MNLAELEKNVSEAFLGYDRYQQEMAERTIYQTAGPGQETLALPEQERNTMIYTLLSNCDMTSGATMQLFQGYRGTLGLLAAKEPEDIFRYPLSNEAYMMQKALWTSGMVFSGEGNRLEEMGRLKTGNNLFTGLPGKGISHYPLTDEAYIMQLLAMRDSAQDMDGLQSKRAAMGIPFIPAFAGAVGGAGALGGAGEIGAAGTLGGLGLGTAATVAGGVIAGVAAIAGLIWLSKNAPTERGPITSGGNIANPSNAEPVKVGESKGEAGKAGENEEKSEAGKTLPNGEKVPEPRNNHKTKTGRSGDLSTKGDPNSSQDLRNEEGELIQRRYYDEKGNAEIDIDFKHGDSHNNHEFPHKHIWKWKNGKPIRN